MKSIRILWVSALFTTLLGSCVPLRQFQDLEKQNHSFSAQIDQLSSESELLNGQNEELQKLSDQLKASVSHLAADTLRLSRDRQDCQDQLTRLRDEYDQLLTQLRNQTGAGNSQDLLSYLQNLQEELQAREDSLRKAERDLAVGQKELSAATESLKSTQGQLSSQSLRLQELERALARKDSASNALRQAVADALTGFDKSQLNVHIKNGKVYVSMEEKLLFSSGSYQVGPKGATALRKVAEVLASNPNINVMIEGHTDPVPYRSSVLLDNWDLSVKRATSVTRILLENKNIEASRIIAAGRGEFVPVTSNATAAGKQKNRRTEIILTPQLDQILNILETR
jgi:chemotaxis protein MotB